MRSAGRAVPLLLSTIDGIGSRAYIAAARSSSAPVRMVRPARLSNPSSTPLNTTSDPMPEFGTGVPSTM